MKLPEVGWPGPARWNCDNKCPSFWKRSEMTDWQDRRKQSWGIKPRNSPSSTHSDVATKHLSETINAILHRYKNPRDPRKCFSQLSGHFPGLVGFITSSVPLAVSSAVLKAPHLKQAIANRDLPSIQSLYKFTVGKSSTKAYKRGTCGFQTKPFFSN